MLKSSNLERKKFNRRQLTKRMIQLNKGTVLVIGLGEIGRTLFELLKNNNLFNVYGLDLDKAKMQAVNQSLTDLPTKVDIVHACIPCSSQETFVVSVSNYVKQFKPKLLIINSTVPPGTTMMVNQNCNCLVAHSPARGVHENLEHMIWEMKRWKKYVGGVNAKSTKAACEHFNKMGLKTKSLKSCAETELAKLFETTYRAWMIACFQEMHRISMNFNAEFNDVVDFIEDTHRVRLDRPVMFPGPIGGHCLLPNTRLLLNVYDSEFLRLILKSNEKREVEIKDKVILSEVQKVKERAEKLQRELTERKDNPS
jgi:UDP-N-acetyl-D-mannosaminuronate dehydrogenase